MTDPQQDRICHYADQMLKVITGVDDMEACTALTLLITAFIVSHVPDHEMLPDSKAIRDQMVQGFAQAVRENLARPDVTEWIRAVTTYVRIPSGQQ